MLPLVYPCFPIDGGVGGLSGWVGVGGKGVSLLVLIVCVVGELINGERKCFFS